MIFRFCVFFVIHKQDLGPLISLGLSKYFVLLRICSCLRPNLIKLLGTYLGA